LKKFKRKNIKEFLMLLIKIIRNKY